ncbi:MAG: enoyl-CoA hydratase/isomerase family protein [Comamonas sp.]
MNPNVTYTVQQSVAEILLDSPPVNAITAAMMDQLLQHLDRAARDPAVKAVILGSAVPGRFCAGLHLSEMGDASFEHKLSLVDKLYTGLFDAQARLGKPSIAAVNGTARGGGMTLAVSCDMLIAADTATFGYPEIDVGVTPAIHYTHLPRIIGKHRAFELLFTGRSFAAAEALQLGLVNEVVPEAQVLERARAVAQVLSAKSPLVMKLGRQAFHKALDVEYRRGVASAVEHFGNVAATADAREGMAAFVEKRSPNWPSDNR